MDTALRVDGHLVLFEVVVGDALLDVANEEIVREVILLSEAVRRDGLDTGEPCLVELVMLFD